MSGEIGQGRKPMNLFVHKRAAGFAFWLIICLLPIFTVSCTRSRQRAVFTYREVMIPMRDGVHLQTVILTPLNHRGALPILFRRTPNGVPAKAPEQIPANVKELAEDGYIFVIQNLRGRFNPRAYSNFLPRSI